LNGTANISSHGIWLLTREKELFIPYEEFPWFKDAPFSKILNVEEPTPVHLYWLELDVDLGIESIEHPERFPLKAKNRITQTHAATAGDEPVPNLNLWRGGSFEMPEIV
jgi:hypothetical protein